MLQKVKSLCAKINRWQRIVVIFIILHSGLIPTQHLGFYCNDPKLSHPYTGDTISWKFLLLYTVFQPLLMMLIFERLYHPELKTAESKNKNYFIQWYKEYFYSVLVNMNLVQAMKMFVGEPRPHFFDTCSPEEAFTCNGSEYVPTYKCTKTHWLTDSVKSFPSGHSSLGIHSALFVAWYIKCRITSNLQTKPDALAYITQASCVAFGIVCAVSRIYDRRHHWWDVLVGAVIGILVIYVTVTKSCKSFVCPKLSITNDQQKDISDSQNGRVDSECSKNL